jgi:chromosome segregation ATPase
MDKFPTEKEIDDSAFFEEDIKDTGEGCKGEMRDLRQNSEFHRLNRRIGILSILIPGMICAFLLLAYLDTRERLSRIQTGRSKEVQALSGDLVGKMTSLSDRYKELEESIAARLSTLEKSNSLIKKDLKKRELAIENLAVWTSERKALEESLKTHSADVANTFSALQKDALEQKESFETAAQELRKQLGDTASTFKALRKELRQQQKEMVEVLEAMEAMRVADTRQDSAIRRLSDHMIDKEEFDRLVKKELVGGYRETKGLLEEQIKALEDEVFRLQKRVNLVLREAESSSPNSQPSSEPSKAAPSPVPSNIIEQDIAE